MKLTVDNVSYKYRNSNATAVNSVNCVFEKGRLYVVMGPSGSGKSTLLSMIAGLDLPTKVTYVSGILAYNAWISTATAGRTCL